MISSYDALQFWIKSYNETMSIKLPKIHLDSGDPEETKKAKGLIGFLDGQTTNPSLVAKNPEIQQYLASGKKLTEEDLLDRYKEVVHEIEKEVAGPISVEVNAVWDTPVTELLEQAEKMYSWGRNIYVKFPTVPNAVEAAHEFTKKGGRVNMTLVFDQTQAAAVYAATRETSSPVFVSPFMGRWDDRGVNGIDLIKNVYKMYKKFAVQEKNPKNFSHNRSHVQILAASIRTLDHFYASIFNSADILTVPYKILQSWVGEEKWIPDEHYRSPVSGLKALIYEDLPLESDFRKYEIPKEEGSLLIEGLKKFRADWESLLR
jgi:transaldolase